MSAFLAWNAFGCMLLLLHVCAFGFEVAGSLKTESTGFSVAYNFTAGVDQCRWKIRIVPRAAEGIEYYEYSFDGTQVYGYTKFASYSGTPKPINTSQGVVETSELPSESSSLAPPIWLAYCSSCYFRSASPDEIREIFDSGLDVSSVIAKKRKYKRELSAHPPHVPVSADFFSDGFAYSRNTNSQLVVTRFPKPFDKGYKRQSFVVESFTNVAGLWLPAKFKLTFFAPNLADAASASDTIVVSEWSGTLESIDPGWQGSAEDFVPLTHGATLTEDRRFPSIGPNGKRLNYLNTNGGIWLPAESPRLKTLYKAALQDAGLRNLPRKPRPATKWVLIALSLVSLAAVIVISTLVKRRE